MVILKMLLYGNISLVAILFLFSLPAQGAVTLGTYGSVTASGWTTFTPSGTPQYGYNTGPPAAGNTMVVYAKNGGTDSASATEGSAANPYATIAKCLSRLRQGQPDWCLLAKGSSWTESNQVVTSGKSATEPQVIGAYDPSGDTTIVNPATGGARPLINVDTSIGDGLYGSGAGGGGSGFNYLAIVGIELYAFKRDPLSVNYDPVGAPPALGKAISSLLHFDWLLVEDCKMSFFYQNLGFDSSGNVNTLTGNFSKNLILRRNVIVNSYSISSNGGDGIHIGGVEPVTIEENVIDHNGYVTGTTEYFSVSGISVAPTAGATYTFGGQTFTVVSIANTNTLLKTTFSGSPATSVSGTLTKATGTGDATISFSAVSLTIPGQYEFNHNIYISAYSTEYDTTALMDGITFRGNIVSQDASGSQFRSGGTVQDNLFARNPYSHNYGMPKAVAGDVSNNVYVETSGNFGQPLNQALETFDSTTFGGGQSYERGSLSFHNNIIAHSGRNDTGSHFGVQFGAGANASAINNIIYDWQPDGLGDLITLTAGAISTFGAITAGSGGSGVIPRFIGDGYAQVGGLGTGQGPWSFTQGTGPLTLGTYANVPLTGGHGTGAKATVTVGDINGYYGCNAAVLTLNSASNATAGATYTNNGNTFTVQNTITGGTSLQVYFSGGNLPNTATSLVLATGTGDASINFHVFDCIGIQNVAITSVGDTGGTGYWTGDVVSGTASGLPSGWSAKVAPYYAALKYVTTGAGTGAQAYISVQAGAVSAVEIFRGDTPFNYEKSGANYAANDNLTVNATTDIGSITGFSVLVGSVVTSTQTSNNLDASGTNNNPGGTAPSEPFPRPGTNGLDGTNSPGSYYGSIGGSPATFAGFIAAASANSKVNWNPALTANNGVVPYIKAGFGISATGGTRSWLGRF